MIRRLLVVTSFILALINVAYAGSEGEEPEESCQAALGGESASEQTVSPQAEESDGLKLLIGDSTEVGDKAFAAALESYTLKDLPSLVTKHPSIMMNAAQRLYSMVLEAGVETVTVRGKGEVKIYKLFSEPNKYNGGKFIVGHEEEIQEFVDTLKNAIRGSVKVPFLEGPAGTGKTLLQDIFRHALYYASLNLEKHHYYTIEWQGLEEFPELEGVFPGGVYRAPLHDTPYAVLPDSAQKRLLTHAKEKLGDLGVGRLDPFGTPDGHNKKIREIILKNAAAKKGGDLTESDIIEVLNKHIVIRRQILGEDGSAPVMDAEGREYNPAELFVAKDVLLSNTLEGRTSNPLAWTYGMIPKSNGSALFLDEFPRNDAKLRDMFLRMFESREIKYGGAPVIPLDVFIISAGNTESMEKMAKEGGSKAHRDRVVPIPFNWSIRPHEVAATLLVMYKHHMAKPLGSESDEYTKTPILDLFPRTLAGQDYLSSDGRFDMYLGEGSEKVHVSPHALMFIAMVTASTRLHIKGEEALKKENFFTARTNVYNNPIDRLKYLMGETIKLEEGEEEDLKTYSALNKEGHFGLSMRDASAWLEKAVNIARTKGGDLTTSIVADSFVDMMDHGKLEYGQDDDTRKLWKIYASLIEQQLILPRLQKDLLRSLGADRGMVERTYDEVVLELIAQGKGMSKYRHPRTETNKPINEKRLSEIKRIYKELHQEDLDVEQVATMFMAVEAARGEQPDAKKARAKDLLDAISQYFANKATDSIGLSELVYVAETDEGDSRTRMAYLDLLQSMRDLGYSDEGIRNTLVYVEELKSRAEQARARAQRR